MQIKPEIYTKSINSLISEVKKTGSLTVVGGKTSTVLPYQDVNLFGNETRVINLSQMPKSMSLNSSGDLTVTGPIDWKEARVFCEENGREILTAPTEDTAHVLSGLATSATGERCFGFGTLREQVKSLKFLNHEGEIIHLDSKNKFKQNTLIEKYQQDYAIYNSFKNGPFPRLERETDLLIGTEGQLGIITEATIATKVKVPTSFFFILLPKWEVDYSGHLEVFQKVQALRNLIYCCELIDSNSLSVLPKEENPGNGLQDLIFIEFESNNAEKVFEYFIANLEKIDQENVFEIGATKCHELRMKVPRLTFEKNSMMGVVKKGTDVQVGPANFQLLLDIYRDMATIGISYNLFGHFGDGHLHFNFMPSKNDVSKCDDALERLYEKVFQLKGSPFAEHGVGLIKQKYIQHFYGENQFEVFQFLKNKYDPENKFFPSGYMSLILEQEVESEESVR